MKQILLLILILSGLNSQASFTSKTTLSCEKLKQAIDTINGQQVAERQLILSCEPIKKGIMDLLADDEYDVTLNSEYGLCPSEDELAGNDDFTPAIKLPLTSEEFAIFSKLLELYGLEMSTELRGYYSDVGQQILLHKMVYPYCE